MMGIAWDDGVLIQKGKISGEPSVVSVNCPDKTGLGCDLCRVVLDFGLTIVRGDVSTDGKWCYIVLWVVSHPSSLKVDWESLKSRLLSACPSGLVSFYFNQQSSGSLPPPVYLLKVFCLGRKGLLHDVTKVLCELELTIQRVKVTTTPDDRVLDLFFITDSMDLLHTKERREKTCEHLSVVLGEDCISCELQLAGPEYEAQKGFSSLSPAVAEELFGCSVSEKDGHQRPISFDMTKFKKATVTVDNLLSSAHTLLQIQCGDHKGIFYDIMRTSKDCDIQIAYGRFSASVKGWRNIDLFIQQTNGKKIVDPENLTALCDRLKEQMDQPVRVTITNRGPDTELLIANPVELSGKGRPRVFYDVTVALKMLGICIFSAEIGRHSTLNCEWEIYRFLLDDGRGFPLSSTRARSEIVDRVRRTLMGW